MGGEAPGRKATQQSETPNEGAKPFERWRGAWWLVGAVLGIAVVFVVVSFAGTFALGLFMYYATRPVYDRLDGRVPYRSLTAATALLVVAVPAVLLVAYAIAVSAGELAQVAGESLAGYESILRPYPDVSSLAVHPEELAEFVRENRGEFERLGGPELLGGVAGGVAGVVAALGNALLQLFVAFALAFYLLRDDHRLAGWGAGIVGGESITRRYLTTVDSTLQTVYFGSILQAFVVTIVAATCYNVADVLAPAGVSVPVPTLLGVLTGVASLVPVVGIKLVYVPVTVYLAGDALAERVGLLWFPVGFVLAFAAVVDLATEAVVRPYLAGRDTHVGLLLFAVVLGIVLFGWYGLFLGPLLLVLFVVFAGVVLPELVGSRPPSIPLPDNGGKIGDAIGSDETSDTSDTSNTEKASDSEEANDAAAPDDSNNSGDSGDGGGDGSDGGGDGSDGGSDGGSNGGEPRGSAESESSAQESSDGRR